MLAYPRVASARGRVDTRSPLGIESPLSHQFLTAAAPLASALRRPESMDLEYSAEELAFRDEVSAWLRENLPADLREKAARYGSMSREDLLRWHRILAQKAGSPRHGPKNGAAPVGTRFAAISSRKRAATPVRLRSFRSDWRCARRCFSNSARPNRNSASCRESTTATISGAKATPSRGPDRISLRSPRAPNEPAIITGSTARRRGPRWRIWRTGCSASCAPNPEPSASRTAFRFC